MLAVFIKLYYDEEAIHKEYEGRKKTKEAFDDLKPRLVKLFKDFYRCAHLIELLSIHDKDGVVPQTWVDKKQYCKFKAGNGFHYIVEGHMPPFGNPFDTSNREDVILQLNAELKDGVKKTPELEKLLRPQVAPERRSTI